jgi:hypothetical protein
MPKPTPNVIRYTLGEGYMAVEGDYLVCTILQSIRLDGDRLQNLAIWTVD